MRRDRRLCLCVLSDGASLRTLGSTAGQRRDRRVAGENRRLRYRSTRLNDLWPHHRVAALNLRCLLALGLTRTTGSWTLATT
jgi:hypothetical protein